MTSLVWGINGLKIKNVHDLLTKSGRNFDEDPGLFVLYGHLGSSGEADANEPVQPHNHYEYIDIEETTEQKIYVSSLKFTVVIGKNNVTVRVMLKKLEIILLC